MSRPFVVLALGIVCLALAACGGGNSSMHTTGQAPVFTSTPVTAAAQAQAYSYQLAATDPAGGTVSYALTTGPTGATLSGNTVSWTPTASQSRVPSNFVITATTSEGGTATQSWNVSPTGTVTVTSMVTNWTPSGPVTLPQPSPVEDAIVPNSDGSVTVLQGVSVSPGVYNIANVPAGYYWLVLGLNTQQSFNAFWTNTSAFDAGRSVAGSPSGLTSSAETTTFIISLSALNTATAPDYFVFTTDNVVVFPVSAQVPAGAQTLNVLFATTYGPDSMVDWSQVNNAFLLQYEATSLGSLDLLTLGPELTLSNPSFTDGATNNITEALQPSPQASLNLSVQGSQWGDLFTNSGASTAIPNTSWVSASALPYVTGGAYASSSPNPNLYLFMPPPLSAVQTDFWPATPCINGGAAAITTDQALGTLQYGDPFPSSWTRTETFCEWASVAVPVGNPPTNFYFPFSDGETSAPSNSPIVPVISQVQNPMLGATSLFNQATVNSTTPTLSWSAPATGSPYAYSVVPWQIFPVQGGAEFASAGAFYTAQTSVTLPPMTPGDYLFVVTALADASANTQTSPYRSALPTGNAAVVSAPITISSSAAKPEIHGDASVIRRLSQPVEFRRVQKP